MAATRRTEDRPTTSSAVRDRPTQAFSSGLNSGGGGMAAPLGVGGGTGPAAVARGSLPQPRRSGSPPARR